MIAAAKAKEESQKGIYIDPEVLQEIEAIQNNEMEISKIKKEFMHVLEGLYQEESKKLADLNGVLKLELHNAKFELSLAR